MRHLLSVVFVLYMISTQPFALYFWWQFAKRVDDFVSALFIGAFVGEFKGLFWPLFI